MRSTVHVEAAVGHIIIFVMPVAFDASMIFYFPGSKSCKAESEASEAVPSSPLLVNVNPQPSTLNPPLCQSRSRIDSFIRTNTCTYTSADKDQYINYV